MSWALKYHGAELKRHSTRLACEIEAVERGLVVHCSADFPGDRDEFVLSIGTEIVQVRDD